VPRLFERFDRAEGQRSRSFEGSGIGLALVHDLVRLHHGTISVESEVGRGTAFTVALPFGTAHLPADCLDGSRTQSPDPTRTAAFVEEALRWLPDNGDTETIPYAVENGDGLPTCLESCRILLADDNADMRGYLHRLLST
jgi:hypothetical protein